MLEKKQRAELNKAIVTIASILKNLDSTPVDPRSLDLLEIAASLLEQQLEQNISYEIIDEGMADIASISPQIIPQEDDRVYDTSGFRFLEGDDDSPSKEDLQKQFDIPWPFNP